MPEKIEPDALYSSEHLARIFGVQPAAVRAWIRSGKLKARKLGKRYFVRGADLLGFVSAGFDGDAKPPTM